MNKENLQRMADYIRTVPQEKFSMSVYRYGQNQHLPKCGSVGCVIGHCTILDKANIKQWRDYEGDIEFGMWSQHFTGIKDEMWEWCFASEWANVDNTTNGAALRIEWLINKGLPHDWDDQMNGQAALCYV